MVTETATEMHPGTHSETPSGAKLNTNQTAEAQLARQMDESDAYAARFHLPLEEQAERRGKIKANHKPKKSKGQILTEITESTALAEKFTITYKPARFEEKFLRESLTPFFDQGLISDVLTQVKGGKEANVYLCKAEPATGLELIAAKVYRPRQFRNLRNDWMYREGRELMVTDNAAINRRNDSRMQRALRKKSNFGMEVAHSSWLMHEYSMLGALHAAGGSVPKPISFGENAILMGYIGDRSLPASTLHETRLDRREAEPLLIETLRNVELMLAKGMIHGDLSAYNILYWEGRITVIDFPQVTNAVNNTRAYFILQRDLQRVCEYFAHYGVQRDAKVLTNQLWWKHIGIDPVRKPEEE